MRALQQLLGTLAAQLEASGAAEQGMVVARRGRLCVAVKAARRGDIRGAVPICPFSLFEWYLTCRLFW